MSNERIAQGAVAARGGVRDGGARRPAEPLWARVRRHWLGPTQPWWGAVFVAPILLLLVCFKFWPMAYAASLSLTNASLTQRTSRFLGAANYLRLTHDTVFIGALETTARYVSATIAISMVLGLALAVLLNQRLPARGLFRTLLFLPAVVPIIVTPILWQFLFHPYGLVNTVLKSVGLHPVNWLLSARGAVEALVVATAWRLTPLCMVIYLAGLQSIPHELYEAAAIDGAGPPRRFRSVTLPMLKPTFLVVVVFAITLTVQNFVLALVMTGGGPDNASTTLSLFVYQTGFIGFQMGYASAAALVMLLIIVAFTIFSLRAFRTHEE
ncbi:MAG TPA: sugar ABC transporter permease [bacterium]|nr:sugar ABC transporter permease [bacterium]